MFAFLITLGLAALAIGLVLAVGFSLTRDRSDDDARPVHVEGGGLGGDGPTVYGSLNRKGRAD